MIEHIQRRQPKAKDISRVAITLEPDNTLYDARNTLFICNISRVVIAKCNKPLGIITEKDIAWYSRSWLDGSTVGIVYWYIGICTYLGRLSNIANQELLRYLHQYQ
jgi:CBS domain-containing protein